ncbi:hypothetical protein AKJ09_06375 [Labilithrix luteola]|uniref:CENP-V/GFA domain-containing protein n=2 Tax=Labilithrix luteola TaxID=1391654 RepID=A0A0K1Q252_9BACT|nr:hypothetical protein AKJ09_06375 [Labilithrix luteola]
MLPAARFQCAGPLATYARETNGIRFDEVFCDNCRTRIYNRNAMLPDMIFLRAGTLSESQCVQPMAHIWTKRKQPWLTIPEGTPSFAESPTPEQFGAAVLQAERR